MAFRNCKFDIPLPSMDYPVSEPVLKAIQSDNGSLIYSVVINDPCKNSVPLMEDYSLQQLLNANVPLQPVSLSLDDMTDVSTQENVFNNIVSQYDNNK